MVKNCNLAAEYDAPEIITFYSSHIFTSPFSNFLSEVRIIITSTFRFSYLTNYTHETVLFS